MAIILSIDTSTSVCSVALTQDGKQMDHIKVEEERSHANLLTATIKELLDRNQIGFNHISAIAVSEGPGSYTGLRIGVSTAKALCYTLSVPLISISTLKAMALELYEANPTADHLAPMIDARRMEVYTALYDTKLNELSPVQAKVLDKDSFGETLLSKRVLFGGDGSGKFEPLLENNPNGLFMNELSPSAWAVGLLAYEKFIKEEFEDVAYFEPFYLKEYRATKSKPLL